MKQIKLYICTRMNVLQTEIGDRKEIVFQSTLTLIEEKGLHGVSMSMISKASETAIGTIYHYFESKEDLIFELLDYSKQKGMEASFGQDDRTLSYYMRFKLLWNNFYHHMIEYPEILSFITQFYSSPWSEKKCSDTFCFQTEFGLFIKEAQQAGLIQKISHEAISSIFLGSVINCAKQYVNGTKVLSQDERKVLIDIIWNGIKESN